MLLSKKLSFFNKISKKNLFFAFLSTFSRLLSQLEHEANFAILLLPVVLADLMAKSDTKGLNSNTYQKGQARRANQNNQIRNIRQYIKTVYAHAL